MTFHVKPQLLFLIKVNGKSIEMDLIVSIACKLKCGINKFNT